MDDKGHAELPQASAQRGAVAVAKMEIDDRRRELGVLGRAQSGFQEARGDDLRTRHPQSLVHFEREERFVLDDENHASGKRTIGHDKPRAAINRKNPPTPYSRGA